MKLVKGQSTTIVWYQVASPHSQSVNGDGLDDRGSADYMSVSTSSAGTHVHARHISTSTTLLMQADSWIMRAQALPDEVNNPADLLAAHTLLLSPDQSLTDGDVVATE